jgi:F-box/WD-40 domain protein 7
VLCCAVAAGGKQLVVTAGADRTLRVVDPAALYEPLGTVQLTDFPYSLASVGDGLVVCGCGDGSVHVVDAVQGRTLYALGAGRAAVRAMEVGPDSLVCSGDDGCVVSYQFR